MSDPSSGTIPATCKNAEVAKVNTNNTNATTAQETINASGVGVGNNPARGAGAALDSATKTANANLAAARLQAEMQKQVAIDAARDAVRGTYLARS